MLHLSFELQLIYGLNKLRITCVCQKTQLDGHILQQNIYVFCRDDPGCPAWLAGLGI